ncbi:MAG: alpha/beta hydrolase [Erysipelotrichaceae bacterium]
MDYTKRLHYLKEHAQTMIEDGLTFDCRYADEQRGCLDPFDYEVLAKIEGARNIAKNTVVVSERKVICSDREIDILVYVNQNTTNRQPCMLYIHGGGYVSGDHWKMHKQCIALCDKSGAVVVNVDYRLAPYHPFPDGLQDCLATLDWIYKEDSLPIDKTKIGIVGDSAGAGLGAACSLWHRDHHLFPIAYQALLYPSVLLKENKEFPWDLQYYNIKQDRIEILESMMEIKALIYSLEVVYLLNTNGWEDPYASVYMAKTHAGLPKTLIITAEFDYLRKQDEWYAKALLKAGVDCRLIRYGGMKHAFFDHCGYFPQAEDVLNEIAKDIKQL